MHVYVCIDEGSSGSSWPGRLLYYFWEGCPFPLEGLIEERWLSPSPPLSGSGSQAKPSSAGSLAAAAAQNPPDPWPVHGPAPTALHYTQMAGLLIGTRCHWCSASGSGGSHPLSENRHSEAVLQSCIHVCTAKSVLWVLWCSISWQHSAPATLNNTTAPI